MLTLAACQGRGRNPWLHARCQRLRFEINQVTNAFIQNSERASCFNDRFTTCLEVALVFRVV